MKPTIPIRPYESSKNVIGSGIVVSYGWNYIKPNFKRPYLNGETTKYAKILLNAYEKGYVDQDHYLIYGSKMHTPEIPNPNWNPKKPDDYYIDGKPYFLRSGREIFTTLRKCEILSYDRKEKLWKPGFYLDRYVDWMCDNFPIPKPTRGDWKPGKRMPEHQHYFPSNGSEINLDWVLNKSQKEKIEPAMIDGKIILVCPINSFYDDGVRQKAWLMDMTQTSGENFYEQIRWKGRIVTKKMYESMKNNLTVYKSYEEYYGSK